jgi:hypothetical protein
MMITEHATISRKNGTKKEIRTIQGDKGTISTQSLCGKVGHSPTPEHGTKKPPITIQTAPGFTITVTAKKKQVSENHYNADHSQIDARLASCYYFTMNVEKKQQPKVCMRNSIVKDPIPADSTLHFGENFVVIDDDDETEITVLAYVELNPIASTRGQEV